MKKISYTEFRSRMLKKNSEKEEVAGVIVFTEKSFGKGSTLEERSFRVSSHNEAFDPESISCGRFSIYGSPLTYGKMIRLDDHMQCITHKNGWEIDYCYFLEEEE